MSAIREAAQKALAALSLSRPTRSDEQSDDHYLAEREAHMEAIEALRAALAEPAADWETRAELAEQQVVGLAEERDHYRGQCEELRQRLAGYRPASLAEPEQESIKKHEFKEWFGGGITAAPHCGLCAKPRKAAIHQLVAHQPGQIVSVTRQDSDGRVIAVIAESAEEQK